MLHSSTSIPFFPSSPTSCYSSSLGGFGRALIVAPAVGGSRPPTPLFSRPLNILVKIYNDDFSACLIKIIINYSCAFRGITKSTNSKNKTTTVIICDIRIIISGVFTFVYTIKHFHNILFFSLSHYLIL
jgi:hypothetical protein